MTNEQKKELLKKLEWVTDDVRDYCEKYGDSYVSISVTSDRISITVYDRDVNERRCEASWHDPEKDEEWKEFAGSDGWYRKTYGGDKK